MKFCRGCPDRLGCSARHYAGETPACDAVKAGQDRGALPTDPPVPLPEAAAIAVRHWRLLGARGFEASIDLLARVLERDGHPI